MIPRRNKSKLFRWLLAAAFLTLQGIAIAHETQHDLHQHETSCALHAYAGQAGKVLGAAPLLFAVDAVRETSPDLISTFVSPPGTFNYRVRAPPHSASSVA